jgi:hypothetical protein
MQTGCPKCSTMVTSSGSQWEILRGSCPELVGTSWNGKAEFYPVLSLVVQPDVILPGVAMPSLKVATLRPKSLSIPRSTAA